jgi:ketosteroid isomerase-like protein
MKQVAEADVGLHYERSLVATAGDRVCLERVLWTGGPAEGRVEIEYLYLAEVDADGRLVAGVMFDLDDQRAAQREALARLIAGDAVAAVSLPPLSELIEASHDHDLARTRAVLADDFVLEDHRRTGVGRIVGVDAYLDSLDPALLGLVSIQTDLLSVCAIERHGAVGTARVFGTLADGGDFEILYAAAITVAGGRVTRLEQFEIDDVDAALARFAELRPDPLRIPPNAAMRVHGRWREATAAADRESLEALYAPTLVFEDRRRSMLTSGDRQMLLANDLLIGSSRPGISATFLATAGDRLSLQHMLIAGTYEDAAYEAEFLQVIEVDGDGRLVAVIAFDPDDRCAASRELLERSARSEGSSSLALELRRAIFDHDLERVRALLPAGFVYHDHRRIGAGRIERADDFVAWLAGLFERSADAIIEPLYVVASEAHGMLTVGHTFGTLVDGGAFESVYYNVVGPLGVELYELEDVERARARFEELRPDPTRIPPNAASRAVDRHSEAWRARDWDALRALASPDFVFEDRSKRALLSGGVEMWIESNRFVQGASIAHERIGAAGDRIVLYRVLMKSAPDGSRVEREHLRLTEVDADGRIRAVIRFDPDDRAAAFAEAQARFAAGEAAAAGGQAPIVAFMRASVQYDWNTARGCLADDFVLRDHRTLGLGALGREEWIESLRVLADLAPGWSLETMRILAWNRHGRVDVSRHFGTTRDGGPFENIFVRVIVTGGDRIQSNDTFDVADADRALARFEELCNGVSVPRP